MLSIAISTYIQIMCCHGGSNTQSENAPLAEKLRRNNSFAQQNAATLKNYSYSTQQETAHEEIEKTRPTLSYASSRIPCG